MKNLFVATTPSTTKKKKKKRKMLFVLASIFYAFMIIASVFICVNSLEVHLSVMSPTHDRILAEHFFFFSLVCSVLWPLGIPLFVYLSWTRS